MIDGCEPIFRWSGGKRRLLKELIPRLPDDIKERRYVEPFLGGGALFALAPKHALLNDLNADLINAYAALQDQDTTVCDMLWPLLQNHRAEFYGLVRAVYNARPEDEDLLLRAAWFIYLMAMCFNGLYRVNASGAFNTPVGDRVNFSHHRLDEAVRVLRGGTLRRDECQIQLRSGDFARTSIAPQSGDFWYLDPPYEPAPDADNFVSYTSDGFDSSDQTRLRDFCWHLHRLGAKWMLSNSDVPLIHHLYAGARIERISAPRTMAANGDRTPAAELIIRNY